MRPWAECACILTRAFDADCRTTLVGEPDRNSLWLLHREPRLDATTQADWLAAAARGYELGGLIRPALSDQVHREATRA